jgi:hypothetical protein
VHHLHIAPSLTLYDIITRSAARAGSSQLILFHR